MENNIIVKVRCNGDIRRMAVEDGLNLQSLRELLSKLYKVRKFKIYRDDLDLIPISDDTELYHILKMVRNSSTKVLRLALVEEPEEEIASTPLERVLMRGDMRAKLEEAIVDSVRTKPVMDAIIQKMLPQIAAIIEEDSKEDISSIIIRNVEPSVVEESLSSSSASSCSSASSSSLDQSISPETEETSPKEEEPTKDESSESEEEEEEIESRDEDEPMLEESKREEEEEEEEVEETKREEIFEREVESVERDQEEEEERAEPEPFIVVGTRTELTESQVASPFKAFMTLVRSIISKKDSDNKVDIANLEDMLKQLNEMGFTDRESNLKLVKFHNQFKEGLDEVVEALLTQSQLENVNNNEIRVSSH